MKLIFHDNSKTEPGNAINARVAVQVLGWLACIWIFLLTSAGAEPSSSVKYLMKEPVSMLDWGLLRLDEQLYRNRGVLTKNDGNLFEPEPSIRVVYAWEDNRIQIFIKLMLNAQVKKTPERVAAVRSHVEYVATYLRGFLTMMPYDALFRHKGFRSKEFPENLDRELVEITDLYMTVRDHRQNILSRCRAPLAGKEIVWSNIGGS